MNRHERRKRNAQNIDQVWQIDVIDPATLLKNPELFSAAIGWGLQISARRPLCVLCDHAWLNLQMPGPAAFAFIRCWGQSNTDNCITSAICKDCIRLPDFEQRCFQAATGVLPKGKILAAPHSAPETVQ
jgi:hypothetical protein